MKLNPDCVRDILINIEELTTPSTHFGFPGDVSEDLNKYSRDEILYHLRQCDMSGFLHKAGEDLAGNYFVMDLSPSGHALLANIRSNTVWNKTKTIAGKIGVASLSALKDIAANVASELIKGYFAQG